MRLKGIHVVEKMPVQAESGGLGYSGGHVWISTSFLKGAREHDPAKQAAFRAEHGAVNFANQGAKDAAEYIKIGVAHEMGHHADTGLLLDTGKGMRMTVDGGTPVTEADMLAVSGYATTHPAELFAEVHALMSTGHKDRVPPSLQTYYHNALATADPEPIAAYLRSSAGDK